MNEAPEVARMGALDMQVCVPVHWTDGEIIEFAESQYPCGTGAGWQIRTSADLLAGCPPRKPCASKSGYVHVTLDA